MSKFAQDILVKRDLLNRYDEAAEDDDYDTPTYNGGLNKMILGASSSVWHHTETTADAQGLVGGYSYVYVFQYALREYLLSRTTSADGVLLELCSVRREN